MKYSISTIIIPILVSCSLPKEVPTTPQYADFETLKVKDLSIKDVETIYGKANYCKKYIATKEDIEEDSFFYPDYTKIPQEKNELCDCFWERNDSTWLFVTFIKRKNKYIAIDGLQDNKWGWKQP